MIKFLFVSLFLFVFFLETEVLSETGGRDNSSFIERFLAFLK